MMVRGACTSETHDRAPKKRERNAATNPVKYRRIGFGVADRESG